jgi:soluble P-type ATPase
MDRFPEPNERIAHNGVTQDSIGYLTSNNLGGRLLASRPLLWAALYEQIRRMQHSVADFGHTRNSSAINRERNMKNEKPIVVAVPGQPPISVSHVLLDFTGTLSRDGILLPGVAVRLRRLSRHVRIIVATADTFGKAEHALRTLPLEIRIIITGEDKENIITALGPSHVVAIGNGRNDVGMVRRAAVGIAVIGPEGTAAELVAAAGVIVRDVRDALDLVLNPLRMAATLRR